MMRTVTPCKFESAPGPLVCTPPAIHTTTMSSSRIEDISTALTMALSNVDEEHQQGRQLLEELNPTSVEFLTLAAVGTSSPAHDILSTVPPGEENTYDSRDEEERTGVDEEAEVAREMDDIDEANRNGWWADDGQDDYEYDQGYGDCGMDWNESGYFD